MLNNDVSYVTEMNIHSVVVQLHGSYHIIVHVVMEPDVYVQHPTQELFVDVER